MKQNEFEVPGEIPAKMRMMKRLLPLFLFIMSFAICPDVLAEAGTYRVEVIVFRNLAVDVEANRLDELNNYARYPALEEIDLPDDLVAVAQKSTYMDGVWRRLRSSKGYRPLIFAAWEQNRTDYYPPVRIHDEIVVDSQIMVPANYMADGNVDAELVTTTALDAGDMDTGTLDARDMKRGDLKRGDMKRDNVNSGLMNNGNTQTGNIETGIEPEDPLEVFRVAFYRLDGTVQLKRSRFLHLHLDIEYREEPPVTEPGSTFFNVENTIPGQAEPSADQGVHRLKQNRQIRTGQMQYFDTPYFGVLVYVTPISAPGEQK